MKGLRKTFKIFFVVLTTLITLIVLSSLSLLVVREIKINSKVAELKINSINGIDQEEVVEIGGIKQYIYIRGEDKNNPVILFLHGGPGNPITPFIYLYQKNLEDEYTVVNWDQRNAGKTYFLNDPKLIYDTLSINRMVEDVKELVVYLKEKLNQEKIIIIGHSWGSVIGTLFTKTYPEYVKAYIGTGQLINASEGDKLAYDKTLEEAKKANNLKDVETLENLKHFLINDPNFSQDEFLEERKLVGKYLSKGYDKLSLFKLIYSPYCTLKDLTYNLKNMSEIQRPIMKEMALEYDTRDLGVDYQVPVFYIIGEYDWSTPYIMAKEYFDTIVAPKKEFITIKYAGHSPMLNQPEEFTKAVKDVLRAIN